MIQAGDRRFVRRIDGREVETILRRSDLDLGADLQADAGAPSSMMGLVGELIAATIEDLGIVDSQYRAWRASKALAVGADKVAEHKVKALIEADPMFREWKSEIARLEGDLEYLRSYFEGLRTKGMMTAVRKDLAIKVYEGGAGGPDLRIPRPPRPRTTRGETQDDRVRAAIREARQGREQRGEAAEEE